MNISYACSSGRRHLQTTTSNKQQSLKIEGRHHRTNTRIYRDERHALNCSWCIIVAWSSHHCLVKNSIHQQACPPCYQYLWYRLLVVIISIHSVGKGQQSLLNSTVFPPEVHIFCQVGKEDALIVGGKPNQPTNTRAS